ncbi:MAG: hypothetical protein H0X45_07380 [Planctomycetes bacterium]|nr:hypothetical protein [Planctomycetota bacterium]
MNRIIAFPLALTLALGLASTITVAEEGGHHHEEGEGHDHGDEVALGTKKLGEWQVTANRIGAWEAGKDGAGTVDLVPAKPAAKSVRVWIGDEEGRAAVKAKGEPESAHPGGWHTHISVPDPIPEGAKLWVVIETEAGEKLKDSFPLEPAAEK